VLGVHTPEFDHEKDRRKVADKVKEFGIEHAVMIDNDFSYWKALNNRYWPSFYLIDKNGKVRAVYVGEMRVGGKQANRVEKQIEALLAEMG
jgi:protein involved in polysaccharide export with SLBB domain